MLDLLGTKVGLLGHKLDKCLIRTKCGHMLDKYWTNARHRTKVGQKLGYPHWEPAPGFAMLKMGATCHPKDCGMNRE